MKLLAIDTSSNACSVALSDGDDLLENHVVEPRAHSNILMPMISQLLGDGGLALQDLDAIGLGNGPGSFIGMRIGASVVQGLCHGAGLNLIPVSSLAAVAAEAFEKNAAERVIVVQDARMHEVYLGSFAKGASGLPEAEGPEQIVAVGELPLPADAYSAAGAAWERYPELLPANGGKVRQVLPIEHPRAAFLLRLGAGSVDEAMRPESLAPAYLRTKVAEKPAERG